MKNQCRTQLAIVLIGVVTAMAQSCMFCTFYAACTSFRKYKIPSRIK